MPTHMLLERNFDPPLSSADVPVRARDSAWCREMYHVEWQASYLAAGGRRMVCWFTAVDAESVRAALRQSHTDTEVLWAGTLHEAREPAIPNVLVERSFIEPVMLEQIQSIEDAAGGCLKAHQVTFVRTFFSVDGRRMLCLYKAPDAESVRLAQREAAMPMTAVWAFERIGPDTLPL